MASVSENVKNMEVCIYIYIYLFETLSTGCVREQRQSQIFDEMQCAHIDTWFEQCVCFPQNYSDAHSRS